MEIERIPSTPPHIEPVKGNAPRPLWSVMIPVYNCSKYLPHTLRSVLLQAPPADKMQIEVIDDCSTDGDVQAIVEREGKGRIVYFRKEKNMGSIRNFETCINRSRGKLVHILHGDDFVMDGFYTEIEKLYDQYPEIGAAFTGFRHVDSEGNAMYPDEKRLDEPGVLKDWLYTLATKQLIQPPAMVVKRSVYEHLGSFYAVKYGEDWEMWARIAAHYPVAHSPAILASYRVHDNSITGNSLATGQNIKDIKKVIGIIQSYLPPEKRSKLKKSAEGKFSIYFAWLAHKLYHDNNDKAGALKQVNGALSMSRNYRTLALAIKLYIKMMIKY